MQASFSQSPTRNADPSYQRSTLNAIPTTNSLLQKSKIPLALILTPYRSLKPGDVSRGRVRSKVCGLPKLTHSPARSPKCRSCRTR